MRAKHSKPNKLALRVLSAAAVMAMVTSIAAPAFADAYGIATYGNYYLDQGDIRVVSTAEGTKVYQGDDTEGVIDNEEITIGNHENKDDKSAVDKTITVSTDEGKTSNVTLDDVNIDVRNTNKAALTVKGNGTTTIELNGNNTLTSGSNHAGLEKNDSNGTGTLIIKDDYDDEGNLKSDEQKKAEWEASEGAGSLTVKGNDGGAGIGGSSNDDTSNIEIAGGKISAIGSLYGAAIGGGYKGAADNIMISGGNVYADSGSGAGIGGGFHSTTVDVKISGGKIHVNGGSGAGIGSGESAYGDATITITGGDIKAEGYDGAGIGTGRNAGGDLTLNISGEDTKINAVSKWGAGIGSGQGVGGDYDITIDGGTIEATGATGIGIGRQDGDKANANITINSGKITATGTEYGAGIGNGCGNVRRETNITITGGDITAIGDDGAAGIGDGQGAWDNTVNVEITGGNITAIGGKGASAIGGGRYDGYRGGTKIIVKVDGSNRALKTAAIVQGDSKGAIGEGTNEEEDPFSGVDFDDITADKLGENHGALVQFYNNYDEATGTGTLYKAIHNQKYIAENYADHINDDHAWSNPTVIKEAAPGKPGIIRYTCAVDGCGATKDVSYDYVEPSDQQTREVGVIFWDAANNAAAPEYLQGKTLNVEETASAVSKAQADSALADQEHWALAEDVGDLEIHSAADAAGTVYEQAVKASGCQYYVIANVTAQ